MNKFIKEQLLKTKILLPNYDDTTTELFIPTISSKISTDSLLVNHFYLLYIEQYIIVEPENFTLSKNWNNNTKPIENKVKARIVQIMGKMVKVYTVGITTNFIWEGWLPQKAITVIEELHV